MSDSIKIKLNTNPGKSPPEPLSQATELSGTVTLPSYLDALKGPREVRLQPPGAPSHPEDQAFYESLRLRARWLAFPVFEEFVNQVLSGNVDVPVEADPEERHVATDAAKEAATLAARVTSSGVTTPSLRGEAYGLLKACAETFVALLCAPAGAGEHVKWSGVPAKAQAASRPDPGTGRPVPWREIATMLSGPSLPHFERIKRQLVRSGLAEVKSVLQEGLLSRFPCPVELLWSYWHEEGMLVQTLNAICLRFQNRRGQRVFDPLANLRLNSLRPLNTVLWGYLEEEHHQLSVARRAYEYQHEYGLCLLGRAVRGLRSADRRSTFLGAFHHLLHTCTRFYPSSDDTTVRADAFPVLNALKELHLVLSQGEHNQFGDLPTVARVEMLVQKWILGRPEIREFLGGTPMVTYKESWMPHVDSMKALQGWSDVSVSHYRDLGVFGEQILLGVRYGDWVDIDDPGRAYAWAAYWRPEIQSYIHSYRAVTGVDLSVAITDARAATDREVQPAILQARRRASARERANAGFTAGRRLHAVEP